MIEILKLLVYVWVGFTAGVVLLGKFVHTPKNIEIILKVFAIFALIGLFAMCIK